MALNGNPLSCFTGSNRPVAKPFHSIPCGAVVDFVVFFHLFSGHFAPVIEGFSAILPLCFGSQKTKKASRRLPFLGGDDRWLAEFWLFYAAFKSPDSGSTACDPGSSVGVSGNILMWNPTRVGCILREESGASC